ncbi:MAG TPA: chalcone isomerase family protein [Thermoanaerobaculia bacterium]|nr:chalcone isomerase family protein [Thermoanaerobaculia bacterium]
MSRPLLVPGALALCLLLSTPALAAELAGVTLPERVEVDGTALTLNGMALRSKMMFKVYVGGLYLPARESSWQQVLQQDAPRHMVMHWLRSVDKGAICEAWQDGLAANTPQASAEVQQGFARLCDWMQDVRAGDRFAFTYLPGEGTRVAVAGKTRGTIAGKDFADALFASWIGPRPGPGEGFRDDLMGQ